ncbi:hypothetical protein [Methylobacterium sp. B4]|uniref:hypothetical protein n=1 Tax=Methylobacterium sp. B4 TaxID=1938755 RepID=UPI000D935D80|nr:hypothetical protein [Methylobacterium sp. B4]PXW51300.1 hypothetical protein BY998_13521 [Methylobacterium sp. B4]
MGIPEIRTFHPKERRVMYATADLEIARSLADGIEKREQARRGGNRDEARQRVARRVGLSPGTLYNLARNRLKRLDSDLRSRLAAYAIQDLENELADLSAELEQARRLGIPSDATIVQKVAAARDRAEALYASLTNGGAE